MSADDLEAAARDIEDLEAAVLASAGFFLREPATPNPLPGMLADARAHAAALRAGLHDYRSTVAHELLDLLRAAPGVTVPPRIARLFTEAMRAALEQAYQAGVTGRESS